MDLKPYTQLFIDNGSYQREKEDLSFYIFKDHDFFESKRHISFFRSDFRGSKFSNVRFFRNNFDRADFISCIFQSCSFDLVNLGNCQIKNCYFENTTFNMNSYNVPTIQQCTFIHCVFNDEKFLVSMHDCHFINCKFHSCSFERSSTEKIEFDMCLIENTDFATMHAEEHIFISCELKNVCLDTSYVFGYMFYNTNIDDVDFLYRGEIVHKESLIELFKRLPSENRYYEFINANIIFKKVNNISNIIIDSLEKLGGNKSNLLRSSEINRILSALCFYVRNSMFPFKELKSILGFLSSFDLYKHTFEEILIFQNKIDLIKRIINEGGYKLSDEFINSIPSDGESLFTINYTIDDFDKALIWSKELLDDLLGKFDISNSNYWLVDKKYGSWELTFCIPLLCAISLPIIVKNTIGIYSEILNIKYKKSVFKELNKNINDNNSLQNLKLNVDIAVAANKVNTSTKDMSLETLGTIKEFIKSFNISI